MLHSDYRIVWLSALSVELAAATAMLDEVHLGLESPPGDFNSYCYGRIGPHNVVLVCLAAGYIKTTTAAVAASNILQTFQNVKWGLMVGVGGGAPDMEGRRLHDIRLGDIVVSTPQGTFGGVVQYDVGKTVQDRRFLRTGILNQVPRALLSAVSTLQAKHRREDSDVARHLASLLSKNPKMEPEYSYQGAEHDNLYKAAYEHPGTSATCDACDTAYLVSRPARPEQTPVIHYGTIASGDLIIRNGQTRSSIAQELDALCFETEAAGLMNDFPCLVVRGISDYADSHKGKRWQPYAAAAAAAYAKELLCAIAAERVGGSVGLGGERAVPGAVPANYIRGEIHNHGGPQFNQSTMSGTFKFG